MPKRQSKTASSSGDPDEAVIEDSKPLLERQQQLGLQLRAMFAHVVEEAIPDDFTDLIERLAQREDPHD